MELGSSKVIITPKEPINLAGFAHRTDNFSTVKHHIYVNTFYIEKAGNKLLFVIGDLIWWDDYFVSKIKIAIREKYHISPESICFHATHNHCGPQTSNKFSTKLGIYSEQYIQFLQTKIMESIALAIADKEQVDLYKGTGTSDIGVYRRLKTNGKIVMNPNFSQKIDDRLTTISFTTKENKTKAVWIHYACHPTTTDENVITSEYPGICCSIIEQHIPTANVAFLQGFSADIRPSLIRNDVFHRGTIDDMESIGSKLAVDVQNALKTSGKIEVTSIESKQITFPLKFKQEQLKSTIPSALEQEWQTLIKDSKKREYNVIVQAIKMGEELNFLMINGEIAQEYSMFLQETYANVLPLGYSNGMLGYIPTKRQLRNGGYESFESIFYFGYPNIISDSIESELKNNFHSILQSIHHLKEDKNAKRTEG